MITFAAIFEGFLGNVAWAAVSSSGGKLSEFRLIERAISAVAKETPYSDVKRVLGVWLDAYDFPSFATNPAGLPTAVDAIEKYCEIARVTGNTCDNATAAAILQKFAVEVDRRRQLDVAEHDAREEQRHVELSQQLSDIGSEVKKLSLASQGTVTKISATAKQLAGVEALIDAGQFITAQDRLQRIEHELDTTNRDEQLSYHTFRGICHLELEKVDASLSAFKCACDLKPESANAAANLAAAYLSAGNYEAAVQESLVSKRLDPNKAPVNLIVCLHAAGRDAEAIALIAEAPAVWLNDSQFHTAAARLYIDLGRYEDAINESREAAKDDSVDAKEVLAIALLSRHSGSRINTPRADLLEAIGLLTKCLDQRGGWQSTEQLDRLFVNRAAAYGLLREYDRALRDCDAVLEKRSCEQAMAIKFRALAGLERWSEAIELFAAITLPEAKRELAASFASVLVSANRSAEALEVIGRFVSDITNPGDLVSLVHVGCVAAIIQKDLPAADRLIATAFPEQDEWPALAARAYYLLETDNIADGIPLLERALTHAPEREIAIIRTNLARALSRSGQHRAAARCYAPFVSEESDIEVVESYFEALCASKQFAHFVALCDRYREAGISSRRIRDMRAKVYERCGNLSAAAEILEQEAEASKDPWQLYLRAARLRIRLGEVEKGKTLIGRISIESIRHDPHHLMSVADVYDAVGINPLGIAYRALILSTTPQEPATYVRLCARWLPNNAAPRIEDGGVTVVLEDTTRTFVTISDDTLDEGLPNHCSTVSPLAKALAGRKAGDDVVVGGLSVGIVSVTDKWHYALCDAIESSPKKYAGDALISPIPPASELINKDSGGGKRGARRERYRHRQLSIGGVANMEQRPLIDVFSSRVVDPDASVEAFVGDAAVDAGEIFAMAKASSVTIDLTALITFARLGKLERLAEAYQPVFISQASVDELSASLAGRFFTHRPDGVLRRGIQTVNGIEAVSAKMFEHEREVVKSALVFATSKATICGWESALDWRVRDIVKRVQKYGRTSATSIFVSTEQKASLVIDDVVARDQARAEGIATGSSYSVLRAMLRRDKISIAEFEEALLALREMNYQFLRVSVDDLFYLLKNAPDEDISAFASLSTQMAMPSCDLATMISVAGDLLLRVWLSPFDELKKIAATHIVLGAASLNRPDGTAGSVREHFLTYAGARWYGGGEFVGRNIRAFLEAFNYWEMLAGTRRAA